MLRRAPKILSTALAMTASVCRRSTCLFCWKCVERTCCTVVSVGWSILNMDHPTDTIKFWWQWPVVAGPAVWLGRLDRRAPAHSPPIQPVAGTPLGNGRSMLKMKSGCGVQEVVQLIFIFYTEIIRLKIP